MYICRCAIFVDRWSTSRFYVFLLRVFNLTLVLENIGVKIKGLAFFSLFFLQEFGGPLRDRCGEPEQPGGVCPEHPGRPEIPEQCPVPLLRAVWSGHTQQSEYKSCSTKRKLARKARKVHTHWFYSVYIKPWNWGIIIIGGVTHFSCYYIILGYK